MTMNQRLAFVFALALSILLAACSGTTQTAATLPATSTQSVLAAPSDTPSPVSTAAATDSAALEAAATCSLLNLNAVTDTELLAAIPGFTSRMVREFQEYRPYVSIQQFRREIGKYVDSAVVAGYEQYVYVPVKFNESDAATLQQIPGIDETIATALINGRPYEDAAAFLAALSRLLTAEQVAQASCYLAE